MVFFSIGIAFISIGLISNRTFLYIGIALLVLAIIRLARSSKQ
jgi:hypothetical protein